MSDPIPQRLRDALADRYELHEELGAGGMATVYLADDLKHERKVAVKVLRPELAAVIGGERFITEIKTTAALQHPHILPLFDSGEADSFLYYVMPFVEGESLRSLLDRERQLEVDQAVHIAKAVASALQYAHERDIIHRDIKPENILLHAGEPVVADFGIALAISAAGGGRMTETGLSLGTPHYMSPEQAAADRDLSARSDVYSLACVLYEMLSGQPPHTGPTAQSILVRILTENPRPVSEARPTVPKHLRAVVAKGLEKLPADRFKTAEEFKAALDDESFSYEPVKRTGPVAAPSISDAPAGAQRGSGGVLGSPIHAAVTAVLALIVGWLAFGPSGEAPAPQGTPVFSAVLADSATALWSSRISSEGVVGYVSAAGVIMLRPPGALEFSPLDGPRSVGDFTFSPDGRWIAYVTNEGELRKVQTLGGGEATLWSGGSEGASFPEWGEDGYVYFIRGITIPEDVLRVPDTGGVGEVVLDVDGIALEPVLLPGGRGLALTLSTSAGTQNRVVVLDLESGDTITVAQSAFSPRWSRTGHLLFIQGLTTVWALPFDPQSLEATGEGVPVLEGVSSSLLVAEYDVSPSGVLSYIEGPGGGGSVGSFDFVLVDLAGSMERLPLEPSDHYDARLSPDGSKLAYTKGGDIWIFDLDRGSNDSLTAGGTGPHNPAWSPDGTRVIYDAGVTMMSRPVGRTEEPTEVGGTDVVDYPNQWLEDGTVLFQSTAGSGDLYLIPEEGGTPTPLLNADWGERGASISPDGRWIAYSSARGGTAQLYVRSWPDLGGETRVSPEEAPLALFGQPQWSPDSRTLYYHKNQQIYAAELDTSNGIRVTDVGETGLLINGWLQHIHPDGRLLVASTAGATESGVVTMPRLIVSSNWFTELRARLNAGG